MSACSRSSTSTASRVGAGGNVGASAAAAPRGRISVPVSLRLVCLVLRRMLGVREDEDDDGAYDSQTDRHHDSGTGQSEQPLLPRLTPELLRQCKRSGMMETDEQRYQSQAPCSDDESKRLMQLTMWRYLHHATMMELLDPKVANNATPTSSKDLTDPPPFPLSLLERAWKERTSDEAAAVCILQRLHQCGFHACCSAPPSSPSSSSSRDHSPPSHSFNPWHVTPRQQLLALAFLVARLHLFRKFIRAIGAEARSAWFMPGGGGKAKHMPVILHERHGVGGLHPNPVPTRDSMGRMVVPQPLAPPLLWDSAASKAVVGFIDQSQEYRLLMQLASQWKQDSNDTAPTSSSRHSRRHSSSSSAPSPSMCLPIPPTNPSAGTPELDPFTAGGFANEVSIQRLRHRAHQCILTEGRIRGTLQSIKRKRIRITKLMTQLQQIQRHPSLRGSHVPYSPFELQLLHSPELLARCHDALSRWLDEIQDVVGSVGEEGSASAATSSSSSSSSSNHFDACVRVWWQWMEGVAILEAQEAEQIRADMAAARASGISYPPRATRRSSPQLATPVRARTPTPTTDRSRDRLSFGSRHSRHSSPPPPPPAQLAPCMDPAQKLWLALNETFDQDSPTDPSQQGQGASEHHDSTPASRAIHDLARWMSSTPGADIDLAAAFGVEVDQDHPHEESSGSEAASSKKVVDWLHGKDALLQWIDREQQEQTAIRSSNWRLVESAMIAASSASESFSAADAAHDSTSPRRHFPFSVHT